MPITKYNEGLYLVTCHIPINTALSSIEDLGGGRLIGVKFPGTWTAANLTFLVGHFLDPTDLNTLRDESGAEVVITGSPGYRIGLTNPSLFAGWSVVQVRSGTTATPVNQAAAREITLVCQSLYRA